MAGAPWNILDAAGMRIAAVLCDKPNLVDMSPEGAGRAAELVRVVNLYNDKKTGPATTADQETEDYWRLVDRMNHLRTILMAVGQNQANNIYKRKENWR